MAIRDTKNSKPTKISRVSNPQTSVGPGFLDKRLASETRLRRLRACVLAGRYGPFLSSPDFRTTPSGAILHCFEDLILPAFHLELNEHSIQHVLMEYLRTHGYPRIDELYKSARIAARGAVFDCALAMNGIDNAAECNDIGEAVLKAAILRDPFCIADDEEIAFLLASAIQQGKTRFLRDLTRAFYNAQRRE